MRWASDAAGARFRDQPTNLVAGPGSTDPERHSWSLIAWADGLLFSCPAGSSGARVPGLSEVRSGPRDVPAGLLGVEKRW